MSACPPLNPKHMRTGTSFVLFTLPPQCPIAQSWYAKHTSCIKQSKLYWQCSDWPCTCLESYQPSPTVTVGKESVRLIARWEFTDRVLNQTCQEEKPEKESFFCEGSADLRILPSGCCESPDFWLQIFVLILVCFFFCFDISTTPPSLHLSTWGPTAAHYDMNHSNTLHFLEHFAF